MSPTPEIAANKLSTWGESFASRFRWLPLFRRFDDIRGSLALFGVLCQVITIWITWPLWQVRTDVPHLETIDLPQIPFGWLMVISVLLVPARPFAGITLHWIVLITASFFDQFRLQPQFYLNALLITACLSEHAKFLARWLLISTWCWAGLHKLLSPDWFGHASQWLVHRTGVNSDDWYFPFAIVVALSELALGLLALFRPRWATPMAVALHLGIVVFLFQIDWNYSVVPWNFLMATIGAWIVWTSANEPKTSESQISESRTNLWKHTVAAICLIYPIGFFYGWTDHGFSGVLYSDWLPRGQITSKEGTRAIRGWGELHVPFPNERRLLRWYFEQDAEPGDKLHISDPRAALDDLYFVLDAERRAQPISLDEFLLPQDHLPGDPDSKQACVAGIGFDEKRAIFALSVAGARLVRPEAEKAIFAVEIPPDVYRPELLEVLEGLPNVMQVQLAGTAVQDSDLESLKRLRLLTGLGLSNTAVTDAGIRRLSDLPYLQYIDCEGTSISEEALNEVLKTSLGPAE